MQTDFVSELQINRQVQHVYAVMQTTCGLTPTKSWNT